jgi:hypothetical protein
MQELVFASQKKKCHFYLFVIVQYCTESANGNLLKFYYHYFTNTEDCIALTLKLSSLKYLRLHEVVSSLL